MEWSLWFRIVILIGFFCAHAADIAISLSTMAIVVLRLHIFAIFLVIIALAVQLSGYFLDISMALCDSGIFGLTIGVLAALHHFNHSHSLSVLVPVDCILLILLFGIDFFIIHNRKMIYRDALDEETASRRIKNKTMYSAMSMSFPQSTDDGAGSDIPLPVINHKSIAKFNFEANDTSFRSDGFKVNLSKLPPLHQEASNPTFASDLQWSDFRSITHLIDSSSCHIYTAMWKFDKPVILKLIKLERMSSALSMSEFEAEACILSRVRHPHIIGLLGCGSNPRPFLVLELLEGGTLGHTLGVKTEQTTDIGKAPQRVFSYIDTLSIAIALASALHYLHEQWNDTIHVIHRDLKPDNIGWTESGVIKIFDFGLCAVVKSSKEGNELTESYKLTGNTGTLRYMAPEVAMGKSYNQTVDVYSFAIIIWQIARGKVPFENLGRKAFLTKVVKEGFRPALDPAWPDNFKTLLLLCWHEDRLKRPSFGVVLLELEKLLNEAREGNKQGSEFGRLIRFLRAIGQLLRMLRPIAVIVCMLFIALGVAFVDKPAKFGEGLLILVVATCLLYLLCLSFWKTFVRDCLSKRRTFGSVTTANSPSTAGVGKFNNILAHDKHSTASSEYELAQRAELIQFNPISQTTTI